MTRLITALAALLVLTGTALAAEHDSARARIHQLTVEEYTRADVTREIEFGRQVAAQILETYPLVNNVNLQRYVNLVGLSMIRVNGRPELEYRFAVIDTEEINAYAAPGGYVFITLGAVKQMRNEAELACVLSHELTHINRRHIVKELNISGGDSGFANAFSRIISSSTETARVAFSELVDQAFTILYERGYKRADEREADLDGAMSCALAGYDPLAFTRFLNRIAKVNATKTYDTHPAFSERVAEIERLVKMERLALGDGRIKERRFVKNMASGK